MSVFISPLENVHGFSTFIILYVDFSPMPVILNPNQGFKSGSYILARYWIL